jgi:membrane associated rhomboid family serine protease
MLILPLQHKLSWRKPPVLTLSLIIINILIFVFYQQQDEQKIEEIYDAYDEFVLVHAEAPHYVDYLERNPMRFHEDYVAHIKQSLDEHGPSSITYAMALDLEFVQFLNAYKDVIWDEKDSQWWQQTRLEFYQTEIKKLSNYAYGFIPAEYEIHSLFTYQFLHGGWTHLLGNMLILFILGFGLERILSLVKLLILYLLTGALSAVAYSFVTQGSTGTLVGASGSISGLMGIFVGVYGLQKIRFFYFLGFAFGYFRFPALIILPIWVANELMQHFTYTNSNVAYFAHIGGFVSGGFLAFMFRQTWLKPKQDVIAMHEESESSFKSEYQQALELIESLKFDQAKKKFAKLWQSNHDKPFLLDHLYHLYKVDGDTKGFHHVMNLIIEHQVESLSQEQWTRFNNYITEPNGARHIKLDNLERIITQAIEDKQFTFVEYLLEHNDHSRFKPLLTHMYQTIIDYAKSSVQSSKAEHYQKRLDSLSH